MYRLYLLVSMRLLHVYYVLVFTTASYLAERFMKNNNGNGPEHVLIRANLFVDVFVLKLFFYHSQSFS